ncbi:MAG: CHAD domain-containing protein [Planctomyces sp.]|nr:CHAD domain-containing protein [Planctomyces sp.]
MSYRIRRGEPLRLSVQRIGVEQLESVLDELTVVGPDRDAVVHQVRLRIKKLRALLHVVRGGLRRTDRRLARELRDLGRALASARDLRVLEGTTRDLCQALPSGDRPALRAALRAELKQRPPAEAATDVSALRGSFRRAQEQFRRLKLKADDGLLIGGLARSYRQTSRGLREATEALTPEATHELRKRAKRLMYQVRLVSHACPELLRPLAGLLKSATDELGVANDHAVLLATLGPRLKGPARKAVRVAADERQTELRTAAIARLRIVLAESPSAFRDRVERYWSLWDGNPRDSEDEGA